MKTIGNIIWIIFGGLIHSIIWCLSGFLLYITIIGIPFGKQCFKMASLQLAPFGKKIHNNGAGVLGCFGNIIWIVLFGWELFLTNLISAFLFAITIIGLPFAKQSLKLARLSLMPFGKDVD